MADAKDAPTERGEITIGGKTFAITSLSFDELQELAPHFEAIFKPLTQGGLEAKRAILTAVLVKCGMDPADVGNLKTNFFEIEIAATKIAELAGLVRLGELMQKLIAGG